MIFLSFPAAFGRLRRFCRIQCAAAAGTGWGSGVRFAMRLARRRSHHSLPGPGTPPARGRGGPGCWYEQPGSAAQPGPGGRAAERII
eukprot:430738-Hanusia_phi.AAC.2